MCPETIDGQHQVEWLKVTAQVWNAGASDERVAYGEHERGMCEACLAILVR
jgi:hypothetical protein